MEAERRAWCPQVIAIGVKRRSEKTTRPFRGKRKLDNIGCFSAFFFSVQQRLFPRGVSYNDLLYFTENSS